MNSNFNRQSDVKVKPLIYFFIPVHNEQATVGVLLYRLIQVMREIDMEYEVYLTLDGCTDDSVEVVEPYLKKLPLIVTQHAKRIGYARCLAEAIRKISGVSQNPKRDFFMVLDADFSFDPIELKEMAPGIERNTVLYLPDRMSVSNNKIGMAKRMANRMAKRVLRKRGADFPKGIDLLSTVRACRIHHLRRNMPRLEALNMLDADAPPAVSGALLYLALQDNSKKTDVVSVREQRMRRGADRFSLIGTLRRLMFSRAVPRAIEQFEGGRDDRGDRRARDKGRDRRQKPQDPQKSQEQQKPQEKQQPQDERPASSKRSRGGRGRRRRPSGSDTRQQKPKVDSGAKQPQQKQPGGGDGQSKDQQDGEQQKRSSSSRRSRRRRRRPNKKPQDSSNTQRDNNPES